MFPLFANGQSEAGLVATDYPNRSVRIICPVSAGGDTDLNTRLIAKYLSDELDESFVVQNIVGGGGTLGFEECKNSKNDGYTFMVAHSFLHTNEAFGNSPYGYEAFTPVIRFGQGAGESIIVNSELPVNSIPELVEYTKTHPDTVRFGYNSGACSHYAGVKFNMLGAKFKLVASGNSSERVIELKAKRLDVVLAAYSLVKDYCEMGDFKVLATCTSERNPIFAELPTVLEQGYDISYDSFYTIYAPKGTSPEVVKIIADGVMNIVNNNTDYAADILKLYQKPHCLTTEDTVDALAKELAPYMAIKDELRASY
jgi:tripartite-type tricarboxylate transporter receptor subunit TctC